MVTPTWRDRLDANHRASPMGSMLIVPKAAAVMAPARTATPDGKPRAERATGTIAAVAEAGIDMSATPPR